MQIIIEKEKAPRLDTMGAKKTSNVRNIPTARAQVNDVTELAPQIRQSFANLFEQLERRAHHGR